MIPRRDSSATVAGAVVQSVLARLRSAPEMRATASASDLAKSSLSALPQLSSLPGSQFTLFLDFDGGYTTGWESYAVYTPVYDFDGDRTTFSTSELNSIRDIWTRVAEDYSPFNINVTTVDPGNLANGRVAKIAIGGNYSDWFGQSAGGVAYVGGFYNSASNVGFVFSDALANGVAKYVAEATSHEAGHLFGLWHQSSYNASGQMTAEYSSGNSQWAPIMGVGYYAAVTTWYNGPNNLGRSSLQDDMSIIAGNSNGFGYRADEAGDNTTTAATLNLNGSSVTGSGVVSRNNDLDYYRFSTSGGSISISANTVSSGADLDVVLELLARTGRLLPRPILLQHSLPALPPACRRATITWSFVQPAYMALSASTRFRARFRRAQPAAMVARLRILAAIIRGALIPEAAAREARITTRAAAVRAVERAPVQRSPSRKTEATFSITRELLTTEPFAKVLSSTRPSP